MSNLLLQVIGAFDREMLFDCPQLLDDGVLTDSHGRKVNFTNTVIIMTSNLGAQALVRDSASTRDPAVREAVMAQVRQHFSPEFINRIGEQAPCWRGAPQYLPTYIADDIVMFNRLKRENMGELLRIRLDEVHQRLATHKITIDISAEAKEWLCEEGYNPAYGARPLNRVVKSHVLDPLSRAILSGAVQDEERVRVELRDGHIHVVKNHDVEQNTDDVADSDEDE